MSHLSRDERLLALDEALEAPRAAHLAACAACHAEVETLRVVVARVRAVDVPEPSPLFWDHLAARVSDAIAHEPPPVAARGWWRLPQLGWAAAALVAVTAGAGYLATRRPVPPPVVVAHVAPSAGDPEGALALASSADPADAGDDGWGLITAMADESDVAAFAPLAGDAELSISALSREERAALINELEAELAPHGGREG